MNNAGEAVATDDKLVHPFFSAPKAVPIPHDGHVGGPITPDASCSPASDRMFEMSEQHATILAPDASHRPKRRKVGNDSSSITQSVAVPTGHAPFPSLPEFVGLGNDTPITTAIPAPAFETGPKKVLMLNPKTGTIGSPPKPKNSPKAEPLAQKKRGRPKKSMIIGIKYGKQDLMRRQQLSKKIEQIRSGSSRIFERIEPVAPPPAEVSVPTKAPATPKKAVAKAPPNNKSTHPFFMGKPKLNPPTEASATNASSPPQQKRNSIFTSTPCSPKRPRQPPPQFNRPAFGASSGILKFPGAQHPAFPWKDIAHVRGYENTDNRTSQMRTTVGSTAMSSRKAKGQRTAITRDESIMTCSLSQLNIDSLATEAKGHNGQDFKPPPPLLRVPTRHFESGKKLQVRVSQQLQTWRSKTQKPHPAICRNFDRIATESSSFDRSTCESTSWTAKYAPTSADTVLQAGQEAHLLRDWLLALKVQSVDTGSSENAVAKSKEAQPKKKRRRNKLDDFIVDDEDEFSSLAAESDDEADWAPQSGRGEGKKTVTRPVVPGPTLSNAILLSGPHGCGKTAAVYGVAKELDFEIFEINPGSRRSGKDILERVGDMTRNHLVHHNHHHQAEEAPAVPEVEDEVTRDLKSGKQGTMMNFFQSKPAQTVKPAVTPAAPVPKKTPQTTQKQPEIRKSGRAQKQSLILLEEVDVLYEEDKQFWATIISMMIQSRRPFVMTCSEEILVPFSSLNLHGILRFTPPPVDQAADLLLLIAASEGHLLQRAAVESLYKTRRHDLRASITELNYWCQIGVGDPQGGFNWFFPRWPKGVDIDENGDTVRVISEGTYQRGMGWLSREASNSSSLAYPAAEQAHLNVWNEWGLDISDMNDKFSSWAHSSCLSSSAVERLADLEAADNYLTALSDADFCSFNAFGSVNGISLDTTLPPLPAKFRDDSVIGRKYLEVHPLTSHLTQSADTYISLTHLASSSLPKNRSVTDTTSPTSTESRTLDSIQNSFTDPKQKAVSRMDFAIAFDALAVSERIMASGFLDPSIFDRTMSLITLDVAPYVRSIVAYDERLRQERLMRSNILSEGGKPKKKMRTTRAAMSALEGGARGTTRRERYFKVDVNAHMVMKTAGEGWQRAVWDGFVVGSSGGDGGDSVMSASQQTGESSAAGSPGFSGLEGGDLLKEQARRSRSQEEEADELA